MGLIIPLHSFAQEQSLENIKISVTFSSAPATVDAQFAYLKYNKAFVLILQADDATSDVYNKVYPLFAGLNGNPGLFMTDGAGNNVPFSLEINHFTLKSGKDVHETDTTNYLSWRQINDLWQRGYSIDNRGFVDPAYGSEQSYQVQRNISYTIKETAPFTKGGITMDTYVLPQDGTGQMLSARDNFGYIAFFSNPSWDLNTNPIEIGSVKPLFPGRLFLRNRVSNTLFNNVQTMALQSINGHHLMGVYNFRKFGVSADTICLGDTAELKAPLGMKHYLWSTGDTVQSIKVSPPQNTTYWVEITTQDNKTSRDTTAVFVKSVPVFDHISDTVITQPGADTLLWVSGGYPSYLWNTGAIDTSIFVTSVRDTPYWVKVTGANGCSTTQDFLVTPDYNYNIDFKYDTACFGDSTTLINVSTGKDSLLQVSWDLNMNGKFDDATGDTVTYAFPKSGIWLVGMRLSFKSGNIKLKIHQVPVGDKPAVNFTYSGICSSNGNTLFTDSTKLAFGKIVTRYWDYGDGISEFRPNIYAYHQYYPGDYTAKLIVTTSYGCVDSLSKSFTIYGAPDIVVQRKDSSRVFYNDTVKFAQGDSVYLQVKNPANYDSIIWPPHILSSYYYAKEPGQYTVKAYVNICPGTSVFYGAYTSGPTPITSAHAMPFFTPNGDGYNDKWVVNNKEIISPFKLRIYNRAGSLVYSSDNYNNDWQGEYNGNPLPTGTYYYIIIDNSGKKFTGTVSIIR